MGTDLRRFFFAPLASFFVFLALRNADDAD